MNKKKTAKRLLAAAVAISGAYLVILILISCLQKWLKPMQDAPLGVRDTFYFPIDDVVVSAVCFVLLGGHPACRWSGFNGGFHRLCDERVVCTRFDGVGGAAAVCVLRSVCGRMCGSAVCQRKREALNPFCRLPQGVYGRPFPAPKIPE